MEHISIIWKGTAFVPFFSESVLQEYFVCNFEGTLEHLPQFWECDLSVIPSALFLAYYAFDCL